MDDDFDGKYEELTGFNLANIATLLAREQLFGEAKMALFKSLCHKPYLPNCEPEYCGFRITGACKYPMQYSQLKEKMQSI